MAKRGRVFKLVFPAGEHDEDKRDLLVRIRSSSVEQSLDLADLGERADDVRASEILRQQVAMFVDRAVEWTLTEGKDDAPVPLTVADVMRQDLDLIIEIIREWQRAVRGVRAPLSSASNGGSTPVGESTPMDTQLASLSSLPGPSTS